MLLACSFLITLGSYMTLPFIPILLTRSAGMAMSTIGIVLAAMTAIQFGGGILGGVAADRFGPRRTMLLALTIRTCGFLLLGLSCWRSRLVVPAALLTATGAALYLPSNKAYLVERIALEQRPLVLSASTSMLNLGMAVGPLVGGAALLGHARWLFAGVTLLFGIITLLHARVLRDAVRRAHSARARPKTPSDFKPIGMLMLFNASAFYIYFFFQNYLGPYTIAFHSGFVYSLALALNASLLIVGQPLLSRCVKRASLGRLLLVSSLLLLAGVLTFSHPSAWAILGGTALVTLAEIGLFFRLELQFLEHLAHRPATAFGLQRLSCGIGASLSGVVGGSMFGSAQLHGGLHGFWLIAGAQALLLIVALTLWWRLARGRLVRVSGLAG